MMKFGEGVGYVSVKLLSELNQEFRAWFDGLKVDNKIPFEKLHVTLMYDTSNRIYSGYKKEETPMRKAWPKHGEPFAAMGEEGSKWAATVIKLASPELDLRFRQLTAIGFRHSHEDFIPHMSLTYGGRRNEILAHIQEYVKSNPLPSVLFFGNETWESTK